MKGMQAEAKILPEGTNSNKRSYFTFGNGHYIKKVFLLLTGAIRKYNGHRHAPGIP